VCSSDLNGIYPNGTGQASKGEALAIATLALSC
jgi:hypothetical protein